MTPAEKSALTAEERNILAALPEGQRTTEALLKAVLANLGQLTAEVATIKDQVVDSAARERHLLHKTAEIEADVSVLKQRRA
ncbi:MAG TPA: hypothetical protein VGK74_11545 [Symbiobacteriaceae bacterium]